MITIARIILSIIGGLFVLFVGVWLAIGIMGDWMSDAFAIKVNEVPPVVKGKP